MKKAVKKALCAVGIIACLAAVCLTAFGCGTKPPDQILNPHITSDGLDVLLETRTEYDKASKDFITVCGDYNEAEKALESHGVKNAPLGEVKTYMDEHGKDKSLVVCYYSRTSYNGPHSIKQIEVKDGKLYMAIYLGDDEVAETVMCGSLLIAGVNKSSISGITECDYAFEQRKK